ncbi:MAG: TlpA family protein disulfide reductase [Eubacteriales bacterium]
MNKGLKIALALLLTAGVFAAVYFGYNALSDKYGSDTVFTTSPPPPEGQSTTEDEKIKAPDFMSLDKDGGEVKLSDFIGKPIVINFWASWCPPCKDELPDFEKLYKEMGEDIVFLMVNLTDGQRETLDKAKDFISDEGYTFPVYFDTKQDAANNYGISSIPLTLFVDSEGYVIAGHEGQMDEKMIRSGIDLLK